MKSFLITCFLISILFNAFPQQDTDYYRESFTRNEDYTYLSTIKTVLLYRPGFELSPAVIRLNSTEHLVCMFDDLEGDVKDYRYTVIHCDANWTTSNILPNEYILGYEENPVTEYRFSFNTLQPYTNYRLVFPSDNLRLLVSGNYLLKVFVAGDDAPVLTRRFMVVDQQVRIDVNVKRPVVIEYRDTRQEIDFHVTAGHFTIEEPYRNLHVVLLQNGRWDNAIRDLKPKMIIDNTFDYNYERENVFDGGSEYRDFDIKSLTYRSPRIKSITYSSDTHHIHLWADQPQSYKVYRMEDDINGRVFISCEDVQNVDTECDYVRVHFFLDHPVPLSDGSLYIFGALTNNQFLKEGLMTYNFNTRGYEGQLYLKQGYYNYQYVFLGNNSLTGDATFIEGNHHETRNEYAILVYYRNPGSLFDELIGVTITNSGL